jgi:hypothetical protein
MDPDPLADSSSRNRIGEVHHPDRAPGPDRGPQRGVRRQTDCRQRVQMPSFFDELFAPVRIVLALDHRMNLAQILFNLREVAAAAQH